MNKFSWVYGNISPDSREAVRFGDAIGKSPVIAALALLRGIDTPEKFRKFISKSPSDLHSPFLMKDMEKAVARIELAIENGEQITIYGDYDVDGITSVSILVKYLRDRGAAVDYYIPDRSEEGYGINLSALCSLFGNGTTLLITVDTGITAVKEIESVYEMGMDVIVTDHHTCKETVPTCCAVLNPKQPDCEYPFKQLAGVGVVFKLLCALERKNPMAVLEEIGDIVALGTIADVVSLEDENRIIVDHGLKSMVKTKNIGLSTLVETAELGDRAATVTGVGFGIAPRINAAGRIGDAACGVTLFLSDTPGEALEISTHLINENKHRQELEHKIYEEVQQKIETHPEFAKKPVLVIWGKGWHGGVIGIVSSRISERYSKPCILITVEEGIAKGSGRSVSGFNLFDAMSSCKELFIKYGGHAQAAGLTLAEENLKLLDEAINRFAADFLPAGGKQQEMNIDFELPTRYINTDATLQLDLFEPYGTGNPQPIFSLCGCKLINFRQLSEGKHLRLTVEKDGKTLDAIGFGMGDLFSCLIPGDLIDIAGNVTINEWNGTRKVQVVLRDMRYSPLPGSVSPVPLRQDFAALYSFIRKHSINGFFRGEKAYLSRRLSLMGTMFSPEKLHLCMMVFSELNLLKFVESDSVYDIYLCRTDSKVDLSSSEILKKYTESCGE